MTDRTEMDALNARIVHELRGQPSVREVPVETLRQEREEGRSVFGPLHRSNRAVDDRVPTPLGDIPIRVFTPDGERRGVYIHFHGGGWVLGGTHHQDPRLEQLSDESGQVVVSVGYRLAPEHPHPAGPDDCEAAAVSILERAESRFGATRFTMGGESAGAHLALVTALRLRDRHGITNLRALNLLYGVFDLRLTPSARLFGNGPQVLATDSMRWFIERFASGADLDDPDVSPLLADLTGMPPAIFTVGTNDPLLDDTLFMHQRWQAAGLESLIRIYPDAPHAFDAFGVSVSADAHHRINTFLKARLLD